MKHASLGLLLLWSGAVQAAPWTFAPVQTVSERSSGVYHHLDSAGRSGIAVSGGNVAIVWEDNHEGTARAYVAIRKRGQDGFVIRRLSENGVAYEPVVTSLPDGHFAFGWEEDGQVRIRRGSPAALGPVITLGAPESSQVTLAAGGQFVYVAWAERVQQHAVIRYLRQSISQFEIPARPVNVTAPPQADQLYPALAVLPTRIWVAWEDRSHGHTRIMAASSTDQLQFSTPQQVNRSRREGRRQTEYGRGPGAARVVLTALMQDRVAAVWLDKREFLGGYDVFAALTEGDDPRFGNYERVQDEFGANIGQWHAGVASHGNRLVAVWDDDRDGSSDIQISWRDSQGWSANLAVPGGNGAGQESSPVITMDVQGDLHLAWIERQTPDGPTRLMYLRGQSSNP